MAFELRRTTPKRKTSIQSKPHYRQYREELAADFNHHCGYCGDSDSPRKECFEIDHFVPKKHLNTISENDYTNLVYACRSCNNAKRAKWPTEKENISNDGKCGWIDPCDDSYDEQFERSDTGVIVAKTELGRWMYDNLKLWKKQHEVLWNIEQLDRLIEEIEPLLKSCDDISVYKDITQLFFKARALVKNFYAE